MSVPADFVHLHVHSDRSLLDGACRVDEICETAKRLGMPAVALTDHGNLFAALDFYQKAQQHGVKPILGCEVYVAPGSRHDRKGRGGMEGGATHLTLLVASDRGFHNLIQLSSLAFQEGFYYKPRIDRELLARHSEGIIALSGCLSSEFCRHLRADMPEKARKTADELRAILGHGNFYIEIQDHGFAEQRDTYREALRIARELEIPVVATNDVHYIRPTDAEAHDVLVCIGNGSLVSDANRMRYPTDQFYFKTADEMRTLFKEVPDAIANTVAIAERCAVEIPFGGQHLPAFACPDGKSQMEHLRDLVEDGLRRRYADISDPIRERLQLELATIEKAGFADYFLIVWDFIHWSRKNGVPVGPGRGSAAGSLVAYCLGITDVDPLKYDLLFERFLNPGRIEMPDIDVDFCQEKRGLVIDYVREKYGKDNVCQIITYGTMLARAAVRDVGRALAVPLAEVDKIAKKIPGGMIEGKPIKLKAAIEGEPEIKQLYQTDPQVKRLLDISMRLEGACRHASTHAAGVVIADRRLSDYVPLYLNQGEITTQWSMEDLAKIGLLKMDFLGLNTLTMIERGLEMIRKSRGEAPDISAIPLDDKKTYEMLAKGESTAVFQLESGGMRDLLQKMKPDRFEDLIAILALYRPGPLQSGMVDTYVACKHGHKKIESMHPLIDPILAETNGVILYQEQVMRIANRMGGLTLSEADGLRKAMGKKKKEILARYKDQFVAGAQKNGVGEETARKIFELMEFFAGYGFNKSHSTAYAWVCYQTAWLKASFPVEFLAAVMSCEMGNTAKIVEYIDECRRLEIPVLPPDANRSEVGFRVVEGGIRFGLGAVKGVGDKAVEAIAEARRQVPGGFTSIYQFCELVDSQHCNKAVLEALVRAGAFDSLGATRARISAGLEGAMKIGAQRQADRRCGQLSIFGSAVDNDLHASTYPPLPDVPDWPEGELLAHEKAALGFYVTGHPLARFEKLLRLYSTIALRDVDRSHENMEHVVGGMITQMEARVLQSGASAGQKFHRFKIQDLSGSIESVLFPPEREVEKWREHIKEDAILFFKGRFDFRREDPSLRLRDAIPIERAREELTATLSIRLMAAGLEEETLHQLRAVLAANPGSCPVFLEVVTGDRVRVSLRAGNSCLVAPTEKLVAEVEALIGEGHLTFNRKGPSPVQATRQWQRGTAGGGGGGE